jgi:hypothetical protein
VVGNFGLGPPFGGPSALLLDEALLHGLFVDRLEREALTSRVHLPVRQPELLSGLRVAEVPIFPEEDGLRVLFGHLLRALRTAIALLVRTTYELVHLRDDLREGGLLGQLLDLRDFDRGRGCGGGGDFVGLGVDDISPDLVERFFPEPFGKIYSTSLRNFKI